MLKEVVESMPDRSVGKGMRAEVDGHICPAWRGMAREERGVEAGTWTMSCLGVCERVRVDAGWMSRYRRRNALRVGVESSLHWDDARCCRR